MERYDSLGVVGEGSYGVVLRCRHKETGQVVAIKKFLESEEDQSVKKIALREVKMLKKLRHENLVNLIEFFRRKRRLYLVFEYVDHTVLDELEGSDGGLGEEVARGHIFQVIRGIAFCHHNQIIHRDVKPENVLVSRLGVVKLCDFGFARLMGAPNESCTDYVATRWYRAPELLVGDTKYGRDVDVWAIGCLLAEMLTADPLFPGESDIDQLFHIIQALGDLSSCHKTLLAGNPMLKGLRLPTTATNPLGAAHPSWPPSTLAFINACLHMTPSARPSAEALLLHDYFTHDSFPETFLPSLRQKVQQEFSANLLLQQQPTPTGRKTSAHDRKMRRTKHSQGSPESNTIKGQSKTSVSHKPSVKSGHQQPTQPLASSNHTFHHYSNHQTTPSVISSFLQPTIQPPPPPVQQPSNSTTRPLVSFTSSNSSNLAFHYSTSPFKASSFPFEEGPLSFPHSQMPPLKGENYHSNSSTINNNNSICTTLPAGTQIGNTSNLLLSSGSGSGLATAISNKTAVPQGVLNLQLPPSPNRTYRKEDKHRKSPQTLWASGSKPQPSTRPVGGSTGSHTFGEPDEVKDITLSGIFNDGGPSSLTPYNNFSRHNPFDFSRHPYAISLDRTKEGNGKDSSLGSSQVRDSFAARESNRDPKDSIRDPLREIRDNNKDSLFFKDTSSRESLRRSRMDVFSWTKPKLLKDDLCLPTVTGVNNTMMMSPNKTKERSNERRTIDVRSGESRRESAFGGSSNVRPKKSAVTMPLLGSLKRSSATSTDSPPTSPPSNLPFV